MSLAPGTRIGAYEVVAHLGSGGMGEVYRARDARLNRDVALKVLPSSVSADSDRLSRFRREAQLLAALNHPNIAHVFDLTSGITTVHTEPETTADVPMHALVMELVEGPTLAERIARGPLRPAEAVAIACQIADALAAAHDKNIVHRDLKPANIKVADDGVVKVLDFGLAKLTGPADAGSAASTVAVSALTVVGQVLGTIAYMSPEQARGQPVDRRTDIWAFGCVLYEMLTGRRAFDRGSASDTIAAILERDVAWEALPPAMPVGVRRLLRRCLQKDVRQRLRDIGDAGLDLDEARQAPEASPAPSQPSRRTWRWLLLFAAGIAVGALGLGAFLRFRQTTSPKTVLRYTVETPGEPTFLGFAVSPDGTRLAVTVNVNGETVLWVRALDALDAGKPLPGTEDAVLPFWSPDGRFIAFFADGKLKKIASTGGPVQSLCDVPSGAGGSWSRDDVILVSDVSAIERVSADGGTPVVVNEAKAPARVVFPVFLPDGRHFLFLSMKAPQDEDGIFLESLDSHDSRRLLPDESSVVPAAGRLLFIRDNTLMAQRLDATHGALVGDAIPIVDGVTFAPSVDAVHAPVTASATGVLVYQSMQMRTMQMAWFDRSGNRLETVGDPGAVFEPALSPDGASLVFLRNKLPGANLWIHDLARGTEERVTVDTSANLSPVWSPHGHRIAFSSNRTGALDVYEKTLNGAAKPVPLLTGPEKKYTTQWSADGRFILYTQVDPGTGNDIWALPMGGSSHRPIELLHSVFQESFGQISPDGHWIAYTSNESGDFEVYVRPFPAGRGQWRVSLTGGGSPRWRADGRELYFLSKNGLNAVAVTAAPGVKPSFEVGTPRLLFDVPVRYRPGATDVPYDVARDGRRFLIDTIAGGSSSGTTLTVVANWDAGVPR